jgi:hypothetical protein
MKTGPAKTRRHWIYALGNPELLAKAREWERRKRKQGKSYSSIEADREGVSGPRLTKVGNGDVLYVYADAVREGRIGDRRWDAAQLAAHLRAEGLDPGHCSLKIFASFSGDSGGSACFAQELYEAMRPLYPHLIVFGFRGKVDTEGFDGHKTAGLGETERLGSLTREEWLGRRARARDNRVQFPPGTCLASED